MIDPSRARAMQLPELGELRVLYADPHTLPVEQARALYLPRLSDAERAQHARFRFDEDRHTYLVAHALVRTVLGGMLGVAETALEFEAGAHGKPELITPAGTDVRFNLSHTRGLVACVIARVCDVGVDVEHVDRKLEIDSLTRSVLSPLEQASLAGLQGVARRERFFRHWTIKEAYVKAVGRGIALPLRALHVELTDLRAPQLVFHPPFEDDATSWWLVSEVLLDRHVLGIAVRSASAAKLTIECFVP